MPRSARLIARQRTIPSIDVVVAIVRDGADRVLIGRRPEGKHMAGAWEFPGGKLESGESPLEGLKREIAEELGIEVDAAEPWLEHRFDYPDRAVRLDVWWVMSWRGDVSAREGQLLRWVDARDLPIEAMLPADRPLVEAVCARLIAR